MLKTADEKEAQTKLDMKLAGKAVSRKLERLEKRRFLRSKFLSVEAQKEMKDAYKKEKRSRRENEKKAKLILQCKLEK